VSAASRKGQTFERLIANHLRDNLDDRIDIRPKNGTNDRGDIGGIRTTTGGKVVAELKNHNRMELGQWIKETETERGNDDAQVGVVIHKRKGAGQAGAQYVTLTVDSLILLLGGPVTDLGENT
jgi:hypothetical protein